ncbi:MAG: methyltransferase [Planctomycetota bacterium]
MTDAPPPNHDNEPEADALGRRYVGWWNAQNDARREVEHVPTIDGVRLRVSPTVFSPDARLTYAPTLMARTMPADLSGRRVLDLGTGCGVLAIAAALRGAAEVVAVDLSEDAVADTAANVASVERAGRLPRGVVRPIVGDLYDALPPDAGRFDLILGNLPIAADARPWHELGPIAQTLDRCIIGLHTHLQPDGQAMIGWASFGPPNVMPDLLDRAGLRTSMTHAETFGVTWSVCVAGLAQVDDRSTAAGDLAPNAWLSG